MQACKHYLGSVQGRHHFSCTLSSFFLIFGLCSTSRQPHHFLRTSPISHAHPSPPHRACTGPPRHDHGDQNPCTTTTTTPVWGHHATTTTRAHCPRPTKSTRAPRAAVRRRRRGHSALAPPRRGRRATAR